MSIISVLAMYGSPEMVGQYALGVAISAPMLLLAPRRTTGNADLRVMSMVFALLGIAAVGFLPNSTLERLTILLVAMAESVEWIAHIYSGRRGSISLCLHGVVSAATLWLLVGATGRIGAGLLGVLVVRLSLLFFYDFRRRVSRGTQIVDTQSGTEIMIATFGANVPCYFVALMLGYHSLGIFAALSLLPPAAGVFIRALGQDARRDLTKCRTTGAQQDFGRMTLRLLSAGLLLGLSAVVLSIIAGPRLLGHLFGPEYATHSMLLVALTAASATGFIVSLLDCVLDAGGRSHDQLPLAIIAIAMTSLACVFLVPRAGMPGAAFAEGFGFLVQITGQLWVLHSILRRARQPVLLAMLREPIVQG